jgi:protein-disulfide isomerase
MIILQLVSFTFHAMADTSVCKDLDPNEQEALNRILSKLHPYDCCDNTFSECLRVNTPCPVVLRLAKDVCRLFRSGKRHDGIKRALMLRARSVLNIGKTASISADESMMAGNTSAPVTVVVYACTRCPFCKILVPVLYRETVEGSLKGKIKLFFKPFPLKDHECSIEGGLGLIAAAKLGRFWPFVLQVYDNFDTVNPQTLPDLASSAGIDKKDFTAVYSDPKTREILVATKREGLKNQVLSTPTLFINGRKYLYEMTSDAIVDVISEVVENKIESLNSSKSK